MADVPDCARCDLAEAYTHGIERMLEHHIDQLAKAREEIDQLKARIAELATITATQGGRATTTHPRPQRKAEFGNETPGGYA